MAEYEQEIDNEDFISRLQDRLASHDPKDIEPDYDTETSYDRHFRDRYEPKQDREAENRDLHKEVFSNWQKRGMAQGKEMYLNPKPPLVKDDLRSQLEYTRDWRNMPIKDRRSEAHAHRIADMDHKAAAELGYKTDRENIEQTKMLRQLIGGQEQQPQQPQQGSPAEQQVRAECERTIDTVLTPVLQQAQQLGVAPDQLVQQFAAADNFIRKDPLGAATTILAQAGYAVEDVSGLADYAAMARNSGTTLNAALGNYVRAEQFLEASPVEGILWLCSNYRVTPQQLLKAMNQKRRAA
jgi:hypothetical protein